MAAGQFELFREPDGTLVVVIQNDLLDELQTRVVPNFDSYSGK